ncbi:MULTISPECIES: TetR/AcrR family transcriptional regulator [Streptomyces]|uniref:TetR family transcriptional regulator n=1 Tax=Streptomyces tsukubensis (strain DSM 42081 / NBRC 108919 / NRRL 18488 / 9993) TaxID=1114943 RepID=I2MXH0_STRT9|nr:MULTISPECIES: TetR/AcrR family transcriptional regulator [Streptomyces]AZK93842.1 TetR family transcriptional regulator [Streptomyces tsukubensis]EIF89467.1 TetR family transcriptional regulator [Streptomyces tsukubensis NRRL18488]MYS65281.1 TetR family transcriptional regulator [Streptomyces sp. SID5473]QKM70025.1 TetR family transcriptional regulator [Streptomyces tsukubensis NRRL18488]TAI45997.1 TetR/AcrR family transcriptional regulator [Streptomyces tsukubensis]
MAETETTTEPRHPDSSRRSERSRRAIYEAALDLVTEVGYARTTIEGIASRAGVGKQTIYRWWPSKAAVLLEAFLDLVTPVDPAHGAGFPDTGDLEADLKAVLRASVDELTDPRYEGPTRALAAAGIVDETVGAEFLEKLLDPGLRLYTERLEAAQEAGEADPGIDPRIATELFVGPLLHRWLLRTLPLTHDYTDRIVEYALYGLRPRG